MNTDKCTSCGAEIEANTTFCKSCGDNVLSIHPDITSPVSEDVSQWPAQEAQPYQPQAQHETQADPFAVAPPENSPQFQDLQNAPAQPYNYADPLPQPFYQSPAYPYGAPQVPYGQVPQFQAPFVFQQYGQPASYIFQAQKTINVPCLVSFISAIVLWLLALPLMLSNSAWIFLVGIIFAFVIGIIGVARHNPLTQKLKWMGIVGIVVSGIFLAIIVMIIFATVFTISSIF